MQENMSLSLSQLIALPRTWHNHPTVATPPLCTASLSNFTPCMQRWRRSYSGYMCAHVTHTSQKIADFRSTAQLQVRFRLMEKQFEVQRSVLIYEQGSFNGSANSVAAISCTCLNVSSQPLIVGPSEKKLLSRRAFICCQTVKMREGGLGPVHTKAIVNANVSKRIFLSPSTRRRSSFT